MSVFFVNTQDGRVATRTQLTEAGLVDAFEKPVAPWHPIQGPSDASTMWYAVLRKRERGIWIGALAMRHQDHYERLRAGGWEEVPIAEIGAYATAPPDAPAPPAGGP